MDCDNLRLITTSIRESDSNSGRETLGNENTKTTLVTKKCRKRLFTATTAKLVTRRIGSENSKKMHFYTHKNRSAKSLQRCSNGGRRFKLRATKLTMNDADSKQALSGTRLLGRKSLKVAVRGRLGKIYFTIAKYKF